MAQREVRRLREQDVRRVPWKNGRGVTRELALWPPGSYFERGDFDWRISAARVEESGPFSEFAGFDRILVITEGEGLILEHGQAAARARLRRFEPYRFSGDWSTRCDLVRGPVSDFNVLTRQGHFGAEALAANLGRRVLREPTGAKFVFVHALGAALTARVSGEELPLTLEPGESLFLADLAAHDELELAGQGELSAVVVVRIAPQSPPTGRG